MGYIVGGYYLIQGASLQKWMNAKLLPPVIWSASGCICNKVPDMWIFTWTLRPNPDEERRVYQQQLGLTDAQFLELQEYFHSLLDADEFGYPNVFMHYPLAKKLYSGIFKRIPGLKLISISLPDGEVQGFIDEFEPHENIAENGVRKKLRQLQKLEPEAAPLGYDVIGYDYADFHSLICSSLEQEILDKYGVRFNRYGLIDSFEDAAAIVQDLRSGAFIAEQGYWAAWLVSEYPLSQLKATTRWSA